jgi:hypothetical protein
MKTWAFDTASRSDYAVTEAFDFSGSSRQPDTMEF